MSRCPRQPVSLASPWPGHSLIASIPRRTAGRSGSSATMTASTASSTFCAVACSITHRRGRGTAPQGRLAVHQSATAWGRPRTSESGCSHGISRTTAPSRVRVRRGRSSRGRPPAVRGARPHARRMAEPRRPGRPRRWTSHALRDPRARARNTWHQATRSHAAASRCSCAWSGERPGRVWSPAFRSSEKWTAGVHRLVHRPWS